MARFGDFTLLDDLGSSAVADRHKATHATLGGPFFLKIYRRLAPGHLPELKFRGDALIGKSHPNLAPHLGHGVVDGIAFVVSPWVEGIDLIELTSSMRDRRVNLTLDHILMILGDLTGAIIALHQMTERTRLAHGDVSVGHVRVSPDGQVRLTGLVTPRGLEPGRIPDPRFDLAGVGAMVYDLVPLLRGGNARPPLPTALDRVIRRALGIGPDNEHLSPAQFSERLFEVFSALKLSSDRSDFVQAVQRTISAIEKKQAEARARLNPASAIPELVPVNRPGPLATLEPLEPAPAPAPAPAPSPFAQTRAASSSTLTQTPGPAPWSTPAISPTGPSFLTGAAASRSLGTRPSPAPPPAAQPVSDPGFLTGSAAGTGLAAKPTPPLGLGPSRAAEGPPPSPFSAPAPKPPPPVPFAAPPAPKPPSPLSATPASPFSAAPAPFSAPAPPSQTTAPRPALMPMMPVVPPPSPPTTSPTVPPPTAGLGSVPAPKRPTLLTDADESGVRARPDIAPANAVAGPAPSSPNVQRPTTPTPPFAEPPAPPRPTNPALNERTDPDATKPLRIEAQKALPAVQALLRAGVVTADQVENAAVEQASRGGRTIEIMVAHGWCSDDVVADALAKEAGRPRMGPGELVVKEPALLKRLPQTYALARRLLPLALDAGDLVLAVADPFDTKVISEVKELVHALGVDVRVAARAQLTQATLKGFADLHGAAVAQSGPRIVLGIQDNGVAQKLGARLAQEGMAVENVVDGTTARTIISSRAPDAVICTYNLPGIDGQALLLAARNNPATAELPVFIIGPRSDDDLMAKVLDLGADDYFGEPVRPDVVVAKLRRAIGKNLGRSLPPAPPPAPPAPPPPVSSPPPKKAPPTSAPPLGEFDFDDLPDLPPEFDASTSENDVPAMPTGVMGTLRQMSLPEIVQSLEMGRKTASVDIVPQDGEKGAIAFDTGSIRFAECGELSGDQAFFALMRHKEGFFRIHYGDAPKSINIDAPTTFLLLEAMRLMDEEGQ